MQFWPWVWMYRMPSVQVQGTATKLVSWKGCRHTDPKATLHTAIELTLLGTYSTKSFQYTKCSSAAVQ